MLRPGGVLAAAAISRFASTYDGLLRGFIEEVGEAGLRLEAVLAIEGPGGVLPDLAERLTDPARRRRLLAAIRRVEAEPSLLGASSHLLAVAQR